MALTGCPAPNRPPNSPAQQRPLRITFLDVGQGDAAVIESPSGRVAVVDGGGRPGADERAGDDPGSRVVVPFLRRRGVSAVDLLVATHADDDHAQGLIAVASRLRVRGALVSGYPGGGRRSAAYGRLLASLRGRGVPVRAAARGMTVDLGAGVRLEVLNPPRPYLAGGNGSDDNENSVVLRVVYGRARLLLTGDAGAAAEADLLRAERGRLRADLLKAGHHGSRSSSGEEFLNAVVPGVAVISAGQDSVYGHPHSEVISRLRRRHIRLFRTDRHGAIVVETDGTTLRVTPTRAENESPRALLGAGT